MQEPEFIRTDEQAMALLTRRENLFVEYLSLTDAWEEINGKVYMVTCEIETINKAFKQAIKTGELSKNVITSLRNALNEGDNRDLASQLSDEMPPFEPTLMNPQGAKSISWLNQEMSELRGKKTKANRKRKTTYATKLLPKWKEKLTVYAKKQPTKWLAFVGYIIRRTLTSPRHVTYARKVGSKMGQLVVLTLSDKTRISFRKTVVLGTTADVNAWWRRLTVKLSKSEKTAANMAFKRMLHG